MSTRLTRWPALLGFFCALHASAGILYVDLNSPGPASPFTSWATAAANIQDAIDAASPGDTVLVTNGVYSFGGKSVLGAPNRVVVTNSMTVQGVNGPTVTVVNGANAMGCAYLANGVLLTGFTLTNGNAYNGGGVNCATSNVVVSNCVITGNNATFLGGGAYGGILNFCTVSSNKSQMSAAGVYGSIMNNCTITGNSAIYGNDRFGGGASE